MDNNNFHLQSSAEVNYLQITLQEPVQLDEIALHVIKEDCPDFLIPFRAIYVNDRITLKYRLMNAMALKYVEISLKKQEFLALYSSLLRPFTEGADWFLDYHFLCIDPDYVYIDKSYSQVYYIYVPEQSYGNSDGDIIRFFQNILDRITITDDSSFQLQLYRYFMKGQMTLTDLDEMLKQETKKMSVNGTSEGSVRNGEHMSVTPPPAQMPSGQMSPPQTPPLQALPPQMPPLQVPPPQASFLQMPPQETEKKRKFSFLREEKKQKPCNNQEPEPADRELTAEISDEDPDEVMKLLYGGNEKKKKQAKKQDKKKPVKEKPAKSQKCTGLFKRKKDNVVPDIQEPFMPSMPMQVPLHHSGNPDPMPIQQNIPPAPFFQGGNMPSYSSDTTEVIGESNIQNFSGGLELVHSVIPGAPTFIRLDFPGNYITIGRISSDTVKPDVQFSPSFKRIGRMHARIEKEGEQFYLIDLGSSNYTLLNGERLIPNKRYLLQAGHEVCFTNSQPVRYRVVL